MITSDDRSMASKLICTAVLEAIEKRDTAVQVLVGPETPAITLATLTVVLGQLLALSAKDEQHFHLAVDGLAASVRLHWRGDRRQLDMVANIASKWGHR
jgi:hypothetical protein